MSERVTLTLEPDGRPVAVKRARRPGDRDRLVHEASMLREARHPGVVELAGFDETDRGTELVTVLCGTHSLETAPPLRSPELVAGVVVAVATTVADLHDLGLVHGRIEPSHVLLSRSGQPVLCGLGGAGRIGTVPVEGGELLHPSLDVYGLGTLLRSLVHAEPAVRRRGWRRRALLSIAAQATAADADVRPTARQLAATIRDTVRGAQLPTPKLPTPKLATAKLLPPTVPTPKHSAGERTARPRASPLRLVVTLTVALVVFGLFALRRPLSETPSPRPRRSSAPPVVEVDGRRWSVGQPGDRVAVADWDCDGEESVALLRPPTGQVFLFADWATGGAEAVASVAAQVEGARSARAHDPDGDGCAALVVERADGSTVEVTP